MKEELVAGVVSLVLVVVKNKFTWLLVSKTCKKKCIFKESSKDVCTGHNHNVYHSLPIFSFLVVTNSALFINKN